MPDVWFGRAAETSDSSHAAHQGKQTNASRAIGKWAHRVEIERREPCALMAMSCSFFCEGFSGGADAPRDGVLVACGGVLPS